MLNFASFRWETRTVTFTFANRSLWRFHLDLLGRPFCSFCPFLFLISKNLDEVHVVVETCAVPTRKTPAGSRAASAALAGGGKYGFSDKVLNSSHYFASH